MVSLIVVIATVHPDHTRHSSTADYAHGVQSAAIVTPAADECISHREGCQVGAANPENRKYIT